ncbi:hypothetical protein BDN72DRAFT_843402 [Pluteus cervinus]|uniref:Uncharacterized protein n=1 Tax=Pluteus cervinus TaxID=181527 RepID=A0ACD3ANJ9_9AGAR|nr:hypothetical protein BDN72DRAFT_843402 [Pluteus cervinus]
MATSAMDSDISSKPLTLEEIDNKLRVLEHNVRVLRSLRNDFCLIYRLPQEVLTRIFAFLQQELAAVKKSSRSPHEDLRWIPVTHVSQRWRDAALNCGPLWSSISVNNPGFEEWMDRSRKCLITVKMESLTQGLLPRAFLVLQELPRIQSLTMSVPIPLWGEVMPSFASPAPVLELLSITTQTHLLNSFPPDTFSGTFPKLRTLTLSGCPFDISPLLSGNLTNLKIDNPPPRITPHFLLSALQSLPRLAALTIRNAFKSSQPESNSVDSSRQVVALKRLSTLTMDGIDIDPGTQFLSQLSFSSKTSFSFQSFLRTNFLETLFQLLEVNAKARHAPLQPLHTMHIVGGSLSPRFQMWRMGSTGSLRSALDIRLCALRSTPVAGLDLRALDEQTQQAMSHIVSLRTNVHLENWNTTLISLPHLRKLQVEGSALPSFLSSLDRVHAESGELSNPAGHPGDGDASAEVQENGHESNRLRDILPVLEELQVSQLRYREAQLEMLERVLGAWKTQGRALAKLTILNSQRIQGDTVARLMALVKDNE